MYKIGKNIWMDGLDRKLSKKLLINLKNCYHDDFLLLTKYHISHVFRKTQEHNKYKICIYNILINEDDAAFLKLLGLEVTYDNTNYDKLAYPVEYFNLFF